MKQKISILLFLCTLSVFSQESQVWQGYFSYNKIGDLTQDASRIYAAAENAYFKRNIVTNQINTISTVEGLSGQNITQIYHSESLKKTIIGHTDGLLIIVNDVDGSMLNIVDIINKPSIPPNKKKINHFMEYNGKIYISTDFGIVVYDLNRLQFGDTYIIGSSGSTVEILQTAVFNGFIYAVANGFGLLRADSNNPNLIDFSQWTNYAPGIWTGVEKTSTELIATSGNQIIKLTTAPTVVASLPQMIKDVRYNNGSLILTTLNYVIVLNDNLVETLRIDNTIDTSVSFNCATIVGSNLYIGTEEKGLITTTISNPNSFQNITPDGPVRNKIFALRSTSNSLWAVYGDFNGNYNPYPLDSYPISKYESNKRWTTFPYSDLFEAKSIGRITLNPNNNNQVFFSSHYSGVLKFENDIPKVIYNASNSSLQGIIGQIPDDIRTNGAAFDKKGNFWVTNGLVAKSLSVLRSNGQWQAYALTSLSAPTSNHYGNITIDKNDTKWIASNDGGLVGFNENYGNRCISIREGQGQGNLPSDNVRVTAIDNKNKLWIGTAKGLRVLSSVDTFLTQSKPETSSIIILDDGLAQELLFGQLITDIVVDGANNKWIGTSGAGVFYISSDGQKTFNIFTKENSPLPSNSINDIDINERTGEVFIATDSGTVSYRGNATSGAENLNNVIAYPNPVRPEYSGVVSITGLMNKSNVKITDIEGNLVYEAVSEGGTIQWDTSAFSKYKVTSGVYMLFISSEDGAETKVKKVMVIR
jgi:ligand-binding sensor domain-containing protein